MSPRVLCRSILTQIYGCVFSVAASRLALLLSDKSDASETTHRSALLTELISFEKKKQNSNKRACAYRKFVMHSFLRLSHVL